MSTVMNRAFSRLLSAVIATAIIVAGGIFPSPASAVESGYGSITGVVTDEMGRPIQIVLDEQDGSHLETPTAGLSGVVTDSTGAPLEGVQVSVMTQDGLWQDLRATDAGGAWSMLQVAAGQYIVSFTTTVNGESVTRFWEDAADLATATVIELATGEQRDGISVVFAPSTPEIVAGTAPYISGAAKVGSMLAAEPGTWSDGADLTYQWMVNGSPANGATQESFAIAPAHLGKVITVAVTGTKAGWTPTTLTSAGTAPVVAGTLTSALPTISGTAAVASTLTASPGNWTTGTTLTYQWLANGATIAGATGTKLALTADHKDKQISVRVKGQLTGYTTASRTSAATPKVATVATPKIIGSVRTNATLTAVPGTWTPSTTFAYQWYADGAAITGATKATFVPKTAQDSKRITVRVTGTKSGYATVAKTSAATLKVTRYSTPSISGTAAVGYTLTAKPNTWSSGMSMSYQWYADGAPITGATNSTVKLSTAQRDKRITVKVTGRQSGFTTVAATSAATARAATTSTPTISGVFMAGSTLTVKTGTWTSGTSFGYQWYADGVAISGATRSTLVLGTAQRDKQISVTVTGRKSGYGTVARTSAKTPRIAVTAVPTIGGTLMVGSTLTAKPNTWTTGTTFTYQWYANGAAISGATGSTFKPGKTYSGKTLTVRVVGSKSGYQAIARSSAVTSGVRSGKAAPATRDNCPSAYPIKGNQTTQHTTDWIFHVPGGQYYAVTDPEECFATATAAVAWGYRASLR